MWTVLNVKYISQRIQKVNIYKYLHLHFIDIIFLWIKKKLLIGKKPKIESKSVGLMKKCSDQFDLNSFFRTIMILKVVWKSFNKAINWEFEIQTLFKTIMKIGTLI